MRVYALAIGDRFTVSADGISSTPAVGKCVIADGYDLKAVAASGVGSAAFYGDIIEEIKRTNGTFYKIRVRKNG